MAVGSWRKALDFRGPSRARPDGNRSFRTGTSWFPHHAGQPHDVAELDPDEPEAPGWFSLPARQRVSATDCRQATARLSLQRPHLPVAFHQQRGAFVVWA
ncbi:MAG: hypothetical protein Kow0092_05830 [Deferrisomatales bacterium]